MRPSHLTLVALTYLAACGDGYPDVISGPWPRDPGPRTDSSAYQLVNDGPGFAAVLEVSFSNPYSVPVYYARCLASDDTPMYDLERAGPDSLAPLHIELIGGCAGSVPTGTLAPGASLSFPVTLRSDSGTGSPPIEERSGSMRLLLALCSGYRKDSGDCTPLDVDLRASNVFTLLPPATASAAR